MTVSGLHHINIRTTKLEETRQFYEDIVGLEIGYRPEFPGPGYWFYKDGHPWVHVSTPRSGGTDMTQPQNPDNGFGHIAFAGTDIEGIKKKLEDRGIEYDQHPTPDNRVMQIFCDDPNGILVEFAFDMADVKSEAAE